MQLSALNYLLYPCRHLFADGHSEIELFWRHIISVYLSSSVLLSPVGLFWPWTKPLRPWWQTATLTGHSLWAHMLFVALSLRAVSPKKDAASWGQHFGTFPSDPSLKAQRAAGEIREERTPTHTHTLTATRPARIDPVQTGCPNTFIRLGSPQLGPSCPWISSNITVDFVFCWNLYSHTPTSFWGPDWITCNSRTGLSVVV